MTTIVTEIQEEAADKISSLNFEIVKCYNLVFSFEGKTKNIGFWILSIFFVVYILSMIIYFYNGIKPVKDYVFNEMVKFGYMEINNKVEINQKEELIKKINKKNKDKENTDINFPPKKEKKAKKKVSLLNKDSKKKINNFESSLINNMKLSNQFSINKDNKSFTNNNKENKIKNLDLNLISINLNDLTRRDISPKESNITLYNYTMEEAFKYDRRNILVIFYIYLLSKQAFFHAFLYRSPLVFIYFIK